MAAVQVIAGDVDATLVRFLRARKGKVSDAAQMLKGEARPTVLCCALQGSRGWLATGGVLSRLTRRRRWQTRCCGDGRTTSTRRWRPALALCPWQPSALGSVVRTCAMTTRCACIATPLVATPPPLLHPSAIGFAGREGSCGW
jgi:hypothetical protein